ncbi:hypothetical protein B0H10DRAFT_2017809 [Mycena sp. CBHHK59/15]|nr:hypothetical protein B0H10DRAFT_2017809 [Mycena sp. CBHHK59/15]
MRATTFAFWVLLYLLCHTTLVFHFYSPEGFDLARKILLDVLPNFEPLAVFGLEYVIQKRREGPVLLLYGMKNCFNFLGSRTRGCSLLMLCRWAGDFRSQRSRSIFVNFDTLPFTWRRIVEWSFRGSYGAKLNRS